MFNRTVRLFLVIAALGTVAACSSSPTGPSGSTTIATAVPVSPANGATVANNTQPITLTVNNASSSSSSLVYTFEVATDSGFANKVASKDVPQGTDQTSLKLDPLAADKTYYWRVRATAGDTVGAYTSPVTFTIGPAITIDPPVAVLPVSGSTTPSPRPTLTVQNSTHSGPIGSIVYRFEIATDAGFANVIQSGTVAETSSQTSFTPSANLAFTTKFYWHARGTDTANNVSGNYSTASTFTTPSNADVLWAGVQPPGTNGQAIRGDNWETQNQLSFDGQPFVSPTLEMKQVFDLLDRGFDPQGAIDWMHSNGYQTGAAWFPRTSTIGFEFMYMALIDGRWDLVMRSE